MDYTLPKTHLWTLYSISAQCAKLSNTAPLRWSKGELTCTPFLFRLVMLLSPGLAFYTGCLLLLTFCADVCLGPPCCRIWRLSHTKKTKTEHYKSNRGGQTWKTTSERVEVELRKSINQRKCYLELWQSSLLILNLLGKKKRRQMFSFTSTTDRLLADVANFSRVATKIWILLTGKQINISVFGVES